LKLLIVDDERELAESLSRFLKLSAHSCVMALNVKEAINSIALDSPEIVITNYRLPDGDGFDVIRHVRRTLPQAPVILITGYHHSGLEKAARQAGASAYLRKPFPLAALTNAIMAVTKPSTP